MIEVVNTTNEMNQIGYRSVVPDPQIFVSIISEPLQYYIKVIGIADHSVHDINQISINNAVGQVP